MKYKSNLGNKFDLRLRIEGEPGTGKTTVINELKELCKARGWAYGWSVTKENQLLITIHK